MLNAPALLASAIPPTAAAIATHTRLLTPAIVRLLARRT
jgi:hypothetical protein